MRDLYRDVADVISVEVLNGAHALALKTPIDTGRLMSNNKVGAPGDDFSERASFFEGERGNTKNQVLTRLGADNRLRADSAADYAAGILAPTFSLEIRNNTEYYEDVNRRTNFSAGIAGRVSAAVRNALGGVRLEDN